MTWCLDDVQRAVRAARGADTCAPEDVARWHPDNLARGQCGVTALVLHDLFGGELMRGDVHVHGDWVDFHWWNRTGGGIESDLTREQFTAAEVVGPGVAIPRGPLQRMYEQYDALRRRALTALSAPG